MNNDTTMHANDLTQLSSREQLSALMDGALPADETRFLLRRLQHDASLAECWERWRLTGEVMRGLAPAQRLPADFATRVGMALHGAGPQPAQVASVRTPAWARWGGGAAIAASLAVAALVVRQPAGELSLPVPAVAAATTSPAGVPVRAAPAPAGATGAQVPVAAGALAAMPRSDRASPRIQPPPEARQQVAAARTVEVASIQLAPATPRILPPMPQPDIVSRPWPRSVLPQYAGDSLTVGFGNQGFDSRGSVVYSPFQAPAATASPEAAADRATEPGTPAPDDGYAEPKP